VMKIYASFKKRLTGKMENGQFYIDPSGFAIG